MARSVLFIFVLWLAMPHMASAAATKLDATLSARADTPRGVSRVIVTTVDGAGIENAVRLAGGIAGRRLPSVRSTTSVSP